MKKAKDQPESEPAELASLVGERIRKIRKEEGLSLELFALRCDMNAAYVGHIERGVQNPTLNTLEHICKGLDISVEDFFIDTTAMLTRRMYGMSMWRWKNSLLVSVFHSTTSWSRCPIMHSVM